MDNAPNTMSGLHIYERARLALEVLGQVDNHRYSSQTGELLNREGTENLRAKAIATLEEALDAH